MIKIIIWISLLASLCNCLPQPNVIEKISQIGQRLQEDNGDILKLEKNSTMALRGDNQGSRHPPTGYAYYPGFGYYKFYRTTLTFLDALRTCEKDGAHLLILNSDEEYDLVRNIYSDYPDVYEFAFIGLHDFYTEGHFETIFGVPLEETGFSKWGDGEPNNQGYEHCGSVHRTTGLNDKGCGGLLPFICELEE